jgi:glycosyltransferase involved in cell wall biosynthesis
MPSRATYIQYTDPTYLPILEHSSRILAGAGWEVLFLGIRHPGAPAFQFETHPAIAMRWLQSMAPGWLQKVHYVGYWLWAIGWVMRWRARWVYASDPLSCPAALILSWLPHVRVIYHEHDSPGDEESGRKSAFMRFVLWMRRRVARRAFLRVLPNDPRADRFRQTAAGGKEVLTVWNCPSTDEIAGPRLPHDGGDLWVLYHGSIVPSRLPLTIPGALAQLPDSVKLRIVGYETSGHEGHVRNLLAEADRLGLRGRIEVVGPVPTRKELLAWCGRSDVGLALMPLASRDFNEQTMACASQKPFDYLACGLAILVSDLPDWKSLYVDAGYGLACNPDDPASIASALRWFLEHPTEMRSMGEQGRRRIENEWNYERQFLPAADAMNLDAV